MLNYKCLRSAPDATSTPLRRSKTYFTYTLHIFARHLVDEVGIDEGDIFIHHDFTCGT